MKRRFQEKHCPVCKETKCVDAFAKGETGKWNYRCLACAEKHKAEDPTARRATKRYFKNFDLKRKFGITIEQFEALMEEQHGCCALCLMPPSPSRDLSVDHCHKTGLVRGLLCVQCNVAMGRIDDVSGWLERAVTYKAKFQV